ncbi:YlaH-like family protein [Brevibacillus migulae]|uniref:YlaH-like family protein n=1 Tax=Brevibacillus migulae TaxID=1644114 RepID=UPI00106ECA8D|nr:YlaH-like family protein [Brevibacillus migulae]
MEWMELVSQYEPANPSALTFYDQLRMLLDHYRFYIIFVELFVVYYLGFATRIRMPILKTVLLVAVMLVGAVIFTILDVQLPVKSAMFVALVILVVVRLRSIPKKRGNPE